MTEAVVKMTRLIEGFRTTALVSAAVNLGILDQMGNQPRFPNELAVELNLDPTNLIRLLRGLVLLEIVEEKPDGFNLTVAGNLLKAEATDQLAQYVQLCSRQYLPAWMQMESAVRGGNIPFQDAFGRPVWQYRQENPAEGIRFNQWLHGRTAGVAERIAGAMRLPPGSRIADIGGGNGILLAHILQRFPDVHGILAEQASVLKPAAELLAALNLAERCTLEPVDFFTAVPDGCNVYVVKSILHDWGDHDCGRILKCLRQAMPGKARALIIERFLPERALDDPEAVWLDLAMMNVTGGRERTRHEYATLFATANLALQHVDSAGAGFHIMEVARQ